MAKKKRFLDGRASSIENRGHFCNFWFFLVAKKKGFLDGSASSTQNRRIFAISVLLSGEKKTFSGWEGLLDPKSWAFLLFLVLFSGK